MVQADDVGSHDPDKLARQILAMYGKHITERTSKSKKPVKKNKELHEVKVCLSKIVNSTFIWGSIAASVNPTCVRWLVNLIVDH